MLYCNNVKKLTQVGLLPMYLDGSGTKAPTKKQQERIPFSQLYNTYSEYSNDIDLALEYHFSEQEIPDQLFNRLRSTALELGLVEQQNKYIIAEKQG